MLHLFSFCVNKLCLVAIVGVEISGHTLLYLYCGDHVNKNIHYEHMYKFRSVVQQKLRIKIIQLKASLVDKVKCFIIYYCNLFVCDASHLCLYTYSVVFWMGLFAFLHCLEVACCPCNRLCCGNFTSDKQPLFSLFISKVIYATHCWLKVVSAQ